MDGILPFKITWLPSYLYEAHLRYLIGSVGQYGDFDSETSGQDLHWRRHWLHMVFCFFPSEIHRLTSEGVSRIKNRMARVKWLKW